MLLMLHTTQIFTFLYIFFNCLFGVLNVQRCKNRYQDNYNLTSNTINYNNYESYRKKYTTKNDLMI